MNADGILFLHLFLFKAIEKNFVTIEDYKNVTESILTELIETHKIKISSIVSDNLPVQISALAHWVPESLLNTTKNAKIRKIFFFSCLCHTTDLIVSVTEKNCIDLSNLTTLLQKMVTICRIPKISLILQSKCPQMIVTR